MLKLIVGLGNPGLEHAHTRHNVGFWWLEQLMKEYAITPHLETKFKANIAKFSKINHDVTLMMPKTFMNASGEAVASWLKFFKIPVHQLLVIHDELDLLPGKAKIKLGGRSAGHNGIISIQEHLGSDSFWRLRIGIGHPGSADRVIPWVLSPPSLDDRQRVNDCIHHSLSSLSDMILGNMQVAQQRIHSYEGRPLHGELS